MSSRSAAANARLLAHRGQELLPAGGNRRAVEQRLVQRRDVAALAHDRRSISASSGRVPGRTSGTRVDESLHRRGSAGGCRDRERMCARRTHSAVIFLSRISLPHFSVSCATSAESSCGVEATGTCAARRELSLTAGVASTLRDRAIEGRHGFGGVFAGTNSAYQLFESTPTDALFRQTSGRSGAPDARFGAAMPMALSLPPFTCPMRPGMSPKNAGHLSRP